MTRLTTTVALVTVLCFMAGPTLADPDVGCGLGTQMLQGSSGMAPKILAATTNGLFGNQTFGISSGTLGCSQGGPVTAQLRRESFVAGNVDRLAQDMAMGSGETLEALAQLYEIAPVDRAAFYRMSQENFSAIFSAPGVHAREVLENLDRLMEGDALLSAYSG